MSLTSIDLAPDIQQHWETHKQEIKLGPWVNEQYRKNFMNQPTKPIPICQCCLKSYTEEDEKEFNGKYASKEARSVYEKLCWHCLMFSHPEISGTGHSAPVKHECGFKE